MAKDKLKTVYICSACGEVHYRWQGQCNACKEWNTLVEDVINEEKKSSAKQTLTGAVKSMEFSDLSVISADNDKNRIKTGIDELDRVLGGGIVKGAGILIGGAPGAGKSTLLLQVCGNLCEKYNILYVSGEESVSQIKLRANRLGISGENIKIATETDVESICESIRSIKLDIVVIDSIQTMSISDISSSAGSITQVRECTSMLLSAAKRLDIPLFIIGHVNKDGAIAGPKVMEHIVDTVLYFEGDKTLPYRILRASKNRFGSTNEIGMLDMSDKGIVEVKNPSSVLLNDRGQDISGSCITCILEGTRPILTEIQALTAKTAFGTPRRTASGIDYNRLNLLLAVLEKRAGIITSTNDVYLNVVGGLELEEPSIDLAIIMSIYSSMSDKIIPGDTVIFGEVGLGGEIRNVQSPDLRLKEIQRLGFKKVIMPDRRKSQINASDYDLELYGVNNILQAINLI